MHKQMYQQYFSIETPLHAAAKAGKKSTVKLLLGHSADVSAKND